MPEYTKKDFPVEQIRRFLEPGPIVLVSSEWQNEQNIMTLGWYTVMEFSPALIGCLISAANHSFRLIEQSGCCVLNVPESAITKKVVEIGNTTGRDINKFEQFHLTPQPAQRVSAPLISECHTSIECVVKDTSLLNSYNFFILEAVKAHAATVPGYPRTIHYRGDGVFMISGRHVNYRRFFKPDRL